MAAQVQTQTQTQRITQLQRIQDDERIDVRRKPWYRSYYATIEKSINNWQGKESFQTGEGEIKVFGIEGCLEHSISTRYEWFALIEDLDAAANKGSLKYRPSSSRIKLGEIDELVVNWATREGTNRHAIIASCPSRIDNDNTIMEQVTESMAKYDNVQILFATQNDGVSTLYKKVVYTEADQRIKEVKEQAKVVMSEGVVVKPTQAAEESAFEVKSAQYLLFISLLPIF